MYTQSYIRENVEFKLEVEKYEIQRKPVLHYTKIRQVGVCK